MTDPDKDAVELFPAEDVPQILETVLAACAGLCKAHAAEREDTISDRVHCRLLRSPQFRNGPWRVHREQRVFDPDSGKERYPALELLRLAIPRRVYTNQHMDYVAAALANVKERADGIRRGYSVAWEAPIMRHFTVELKPAE